MIRGLHAMLYSSHAVRELESRGVKFTQAIEDHGYGLVTDFKVPGGFEVQLYQPRYSKGTAGLGAPSEAKD